MANEHPPANRRGASRGSHSIQDELVIFNHHVRGTIVAVLPQVPEDAPYRVREGIARRRLVATTGHCPCGATVDYDAIRNGSRSVEVQHERLCPAVTDRLVKAIRRWSR